MLARNLQIGSFNFKPYWILCKPNVVALMLITASVGMYLASPGTIAWSLFFWTNLGIALTGGAAAAINHVVDRHIDSQMHRTHKRPLVQGELSPRQALQFAGFIGLAGIIILSVFVNKLTALLSVATFLGYAVFYTMYLKRATPQNIVIGGLAGASPPLLGWTAVSNQLDPLGFLLVLIIFTWTPPHFWALAIARRAEYAKANIPMLPITHGVAFTKLCIFLYTCLLTGVTTLVWATNHAHALYIGLTSLLNAKFLWHSWRLYRSPDNKEAGPIFKYSIWYLALLFLGLSLDHGLWLKGFLS